MEDEIRIQVEDNSPSTEYDIEYSICLTLYVSWLLIISIAHPRSCPKAITIILRIVHLIAYSIFVMNDVINFFTFDSVFESKTFTIVYNINKVICYISIYYYIYHGIKQYNKWPELINGINVLDQKIRGEISMNDRHIENMQAILITFLCGSVSLIVLTLYYYIIRLENIFVFDFLLCYMTAQTLIKSFVFSIVVYILYQRFQMINKLIGQLDELSNALLIPNKIRLIRELYTDTCGLVSMVNDIYGFYLFFCSVNCFTMVTVTLFKIYIDFVNKTYAFILINCILWILYVAHFSLICWVCTILRKESDKTGTIIHAIELKYNPANLDELNDATNQLSLEDRNSIRKEVNCFSTQLQQHQITITACDFFKMKNSLFISFVGAVITYLIILIQFYQSEEVNPSA